MSLLNQELYVLKGLDVFLEPVYMLMNAVADVDV